MAFIRVEPVEVQVRTNWFSGRPREITWGDERLPITRLAAVREEAAAYPVITGPRTLFEVDTPRARLSLDLPAPFPPLDGDRPGRPGRRASRRLIAADPIPAAASSRPLPVDRLPDRPIARAPIVGTSGRARRYRARPAPTPRAHDRARRSGRNRTIRRVDHPGEPRFRDLTLDRFVGELASAAPVPGGGSASAVAASLGAGLVAMVASLSMDRAEVRPARRRCWPGRRRPGRRLADRFLALADEDAAAYAGFAAGDEAAARHRRAARDPRPRPCSTAARHAAEVPLVAVEACVELVGVAEALAGRSNDERLERSQRRGAARRGGGPRRRRERPGQPARVGDPDYMTRDDGARRRAAPRGGAAGVADPRGRRQRRAARARSRRRREPDAMTASGARLLEGGRHRRGDPDRGRRGRRGVHRGPRPAARPARGDRRQGRALDGLPRADPARLRQGRHRRRVRGARGRGDRSRGDGDRPRAQRGPDAWTASSSRCRSRRRSGCAPSSTRSTRPRTSTASTRSTPGCCASATTASCRRPPTPPSRSCAGPGSRSRARRGRHRAVGRGRHAGGVPAGPGGRDGHRLPLADARPGRPRPAGRDRGRGRRACRASSPARCSSPGAVVVDVGINVVGGRIVGDVDFESAARGRLGDHAGARRRRAADQRAAAHPPRSGPPNARRHGRPARHATPARTAEETDELPVRSRDRPLRHAAPDRRRGARPRDRRRRARAVRPDQGQGHARGDPAPRGGAPARQVRRGHGDHADAAGRGQVDDHGRAGPGPQPHRHAGGGEHPPAVARARSSGSRAARPAAATARSSRWRTSTST